MKNVWFNNCILSLKNASYKLIKRIIFKIHAILRRSKEQSLTSYEEPQANGHNEQAGNYPLWSRLKKDKISIKHILLENIKWSNSCIFFKSIYIGSQYSSQYQSIKW